MYACIWCLHACDACVTHMRHVCDTCVTRVTHMWHTCVTCLWHKCVTYVSHMLQHVCTAMCSTHLHSHSESHWSECLSRTDTCEWMLVECLSDLCYELLSNTNASNVYYECLLVTSAYKYLEMVLMLQISAVTNAFQIRMLVNSSKFKLFMGILTCCIEFWGKY